MRAEDLLADLAVRFALRRAYLESDVGGTDHDALLFDGLRTALREARRVARPGAPVVIQVWGRPERCDLMAVFGAIAPLLPPPAPGERDPHASSEPGPLESLAKVAGLVPDGTGDVTTVFEFAHEAALLSALLSPGVAVLAVRTAGEEVVSRAILEAAGRFRTPGGGYRFENEWHYLIAGA